MEQNNTVANPAPQTNLDFYMPLYGVDEYINDRSSWHRQLYSITGERGYFYFKVCFNFQKENGLLGGIMSPGLKDGQTSKVSYEPTKNNAINYLLAHASRYKSSLIEDRMLALYKFVGTLSYLSCEAPWVFKEVDGLENIRVNFGQSQEQEKRLTLTLLPDSVDMRITTLFDLYKFICYDSINQRVVLPDNMRKFDMSIILFHVPIKYYNTGIMTSSQTFKFGGHSKRTEIANSILGATTNNAKYFKSKTFIDMIEGKFCNAPSFKMWTFKNCEFDINSLNTGFMGFNNEKPFALGETKVGITYERSFEHTLNEWTQFMFGSDGFYWNEHPVDSPIEQLNALAKKIIANDEPNTQADRIQGINNGLMNKTYNPDIEQYKGLIDASEAILRDGLMNKSFAKDIMYEMYGNLYGSFTDISQQYFHKKLMLLMGKDASGTDLGPLGNLNILSRTIGSNSDTKDEGQIYYDNKLKLLKGGLKLQKLDDIIINSHEYIAAKANLFAGKTIYGEKISSESDSLGSINVSSTSNKDYFDKKLNFLRGYDINGTTKLNSLGELQINSEDYDKAKLNLLLGKDSQGAELGKLGSLSIDSKEYADEKLKLLSSSTQSDIGNMHSNKANKLSNKQKQQTLVNEKLATLLQTGLTKEAKNNEGALFNAAKSELTSIVNTIVNKVNNSDGTTSDRELIASEIDSKLSVIINQAKDVSTKQSKYDAAKANLNILIDAIKKDNKIIVEASKRDELITEIERQLLELFKTGYSSDYSLSREMLIKDIRSENGTRKMSTKNKIANMFGFEMT